MSFLEVIQRSKDAAIARMQPQLLAWTNLVEKIVTVLTPIMNKEDEEAFLFSLELEFSWDEEIYDAYLEGKDYGEDNFSQEDFYQGKKDFLYNEIKNLYYSHRFFSNNQIIEEIDQAFNCNSMKSALNC